MTYSQIIEILSNSTYYWLVLLEWRTAPLSNSAVSQWLLTKTKDNATRAESDATQDFIRPNSNSSND
jgi:hypothetical protein